MEQIQDSLAWWMQSYQDLAVAGVRSPAVADKIALHLQRFLTFFQQGYGHDRLSACLHRDVVAWQRVLQEQGLSNATVNSHLASLSGFMTWVGAQASNAFARGKPTKGISELGLAAPEPRVEWGANPNAQESVRPSAPFLSAQRPPSRQSIRNSDPYAGQTLA